jgi:hypothetical protein
MSSPRDRDLRLERLGNRDTLRRAHLNEVALVSSPVAGADSAWEVRATYEAIVDAVFTAPGAAEWLLGLQRALAARFAGKDAAPAAREAIRKASPSPWRA